VGDYSDTRGKTMSILRHKNLAAFKQLGFFPEKAAGSTQVTGNCPFCGADRFYINPETKKWDCKKCLKTGGFKTYVSECVKTFAKNMKGPKHEEFAASRGFSIGDMTAHEFGYIPASGAYILPIYNVEHSEIWDVRIYKDKKFMSLSGCQVGLFGWDKFDKSADTVWLCEGEWDKIAMEIMLRENGIDDPVLAVPGCGTFKNEWVQFFDGKIVNVMYDHDEPGKRGAHKVEQMLRSNTKELRFVHWHAKKEIGYDVRDYLNGTAKIKSVRLDKLEKMLKPHPPELADGGSVEVNTNKPKGLDKYDGPYVDRNLIHETYRKWLYLPYTDVLDVMYGTMLANRLEGDPLWLFLVAPPGGTKTELINSISDAPNVVTTSSLTPKSLVSGANTAGGGDPSLIPKLDHKMLLVKDFTTILNMNPLIRDEIFAILRDAYDGKTEKDFGNGIHRSYKSKFGIISGVTPAIELYTEGNTSLGERFLRFDIPIPADARGRVEYLKRAEQNAGKENQMRQELAELGTSVLRHDFNAIPMIDEKIRNKAIALAQFLAKMRGTVVRDKFTKEITHNAFSELGTRIVKQFTKLMYGIGMYRNVGVVDEEIYSIVKRMALSTVPHRLEYIVRFMYQQDAEMEYRTDDIAHQLKLPAMTCARLLENLDMLGIVEQRRESALKTTWKLNEDGIYLIDEGGIY
jgi:hypothetical protein